MDPDDERTFGEIILDLIEQETVIEKTGWGVEVVEKVTRALHSVRPGMKEFEVVVYWASLVTAFTAPGNHIFFSRRLLERCRSEAMVAFVVAHEMAHHDLGHLDLFPSWMKEFSAIRGTKFLGEAAQAVERRLYGPERECQADNHALTLCLKAGYDLAECLELFKILEDYYLDMGAVDLALGLDPDSDQELSSDAPPLTKLRTWAWTRAKGYLPVQDRAAEAEKFAQSLKQDTNKATHSNSPSG